MAVYTELTPADIGPWLPRFFQGERLIRLTPISGGIENTNYFVDLEGTSGTRRVVLTVFETLPARALPFFARLTVKLAHHGLPVPAPFEDQRGHWVCRMGGKPAMWLPCLPGQHVTRPNAPQCKALGDFMQRMHAQTMNVPGEPHPRTLAWMQDVLDRAVTMPEAQRMDVLQAIRAMGDAMPAIEALPRGVVHGDLFIDNALFEGDRLTGVIDFYHAAQAPLLFDVAVALNDWCFRDGDYDDASCTALLSGYRALEPAEVQLLASVLRLAALRFWVSRLDSLYGGGYQHRAKAGETLKDPGQMAERYHSASTLTSSRVTAWLS
ncbi:MAG: homoserine kinase [Gammaproteobacteria bacterium]|nr:MAG: homoserine kinase [Gammaproteobacteria bacterium]